jgi:hypothetical protein
LIRILEGVLTGGSLWALVKWSLDEAKYAKEKARMGLK